MRPSSVKTLLLLLFTFSGITGLIYEVAWSKYLTSFLGSTAYSNMIVLSSFMAGLAAGAFYLGKIADGVKNPLRLYALLELSIGAYCIAYPFLHNIGEHGFVFIAQSAHMAPAGSALLLLKFLISITLLIVPTFLMGGTLPILVRFFSTNLRDVGHDVAMLYAVNSLGAILGAGLGGFFLIQAFTLDGAVWIAAAMNLLIGVAGMWLARSATIAASGEQRAMQEEETPKFSPALARLAWIVAGISGFVAMLYELAWTRFLLPILGSSTYSFSVMLIAFISGIALGSWIVSKIVRRMKNLFLLLVICQIGTAVFMLLSLPLYERLPYILWKLSSNLAMNASSFPVFLVLEFFFCFMLMIVPTTFSGMSLPIASRIASRDLARVGKLVGNVFSINTVGTVLGALATGLVFIPQFGVKHAMEIGIYVNALLGIILLFRTRQVSSRIRFGLTIVLAGFIVGWQVLFPTWNVNIANLGVFRVLSHRPPASFDAYKNTLEGKSTLLWYREGLTAAVSVREMENGDGKKQKTLSINGKADASTYADIQTQILLGQLPLLLWPDSGKALVIGLGSGITAGSMLQHPLQSLDCVEISPEVVECNSFFSEENHHLLQDPRLKMYIEDGITFLEMTNDTYNYIVSEPSNPWIAGIGNLFTVEFFELCKQRLKPDGVLVQWFHLYEMNDDVFKLVVRTMTKSFPYVTAWAPSGVDIIFLASRAPLTLDGERLRNLFQDPSISRELARISIMDIPSLLATQSISDLKSAIPVGDGSVNTISNSLLEYLAPVTFFSNASVQIANKLDERISQSGNNLLLHDYQRTTVLTAENYFNIGQYYFMMSKPLYSFAYSALRKCIQLDTNNIKAKVLLSKICLTLGYDGDRLVLLSDLATRYPEDITIVGDYAQALTNWRMRSSSILNPPDLRAPIALMERCILLTKEQDERFYFYLADLLTTSSRYAEAAGVLEKVLALRGRYKPLVGSKTEDDINIAIADDLIAVGRLDDARNYLRRARLLNPGNERIPAISRKLELYK